MLNVAVCQSDSGKGGIEASDIVKQELHNLASECLLRNLQGEDLCIGRQPVYLLPVQALGTRPQGHHQSPPIRGDEASDMLESDGGLTAVGTLSL